MTILSDAITALSPSWYDDLDTGWTTSGGATLTPSVDLLGQGVNVPTINKAATTDQAYNNMGGNTADIEANGHSLWSLVGFFRIDSMPPGGTGDDFATLVFTGRSGPTRADIYVWFMPDGSIGMTRWNGASNSAAQSSAGVLVTGEAYFLSVVDDGVNQKLYIDNVEVAAMTSVSGTTISDMRLNSYWPSSHSYAMRGSFSDWAVFLDKALTEGEREGIYQASGLAPVVNVPQSSVMTLDEVALFDRALTPEEVSSLYGQSSGALSPGVSIKEFYSTGSYVTLSDSNRIAESDTVGLFNNTAYIDVPIKTTHKAYVEFVITEVDDDSFIYFGIKPNKEFQSQPTENGTFYVVLDATGAGNVSRTVQGAIAQDSHDAHTALAVNNVVSMAFDYDAMTMTVKLNDTIVGDIDGADLTGGSYNLNDYTTDAYFFVLFSGNWKAFLRSAESDLAYSLPEGYVALEDLVDPDIPGSIAGEWSAWEGALAGTFGASYGINGDWPVWNGAIGAVVTKPPGWIDAHWPAWTGSIDGEGGVEPAVLYYSTHSWTTNASSTPANQVLEPRVGNPGNFARSVAIGDFGVSPLTVGELVLKNVDGALDNLMDNGFDGQKITIYRGTKKATFPSGFTKVFVGVATDIKFSRSDITLSLRDNLTYLDTPVLNESFAGTGGPEGATNWANKKRQRLLEGREFIPVQFIDETLLIYYVGKGCYDDKGYEWSGGTGWSNSKYLRCYEGGVLIQRDTDYATLASLSEATNFPDSGKCRFYQGSEGTWVRLGSIPTYEIRVSVPDVRIVPSQPNWSWLPHYHFMAEVVPDEFIESSGGRAVGKYLIQDETTSYADALSEVAKANGGFIWQKNDGKIKFGAASPPYYNADVIKYEFNESNVKTFSVRQASIFHTVEFYSEKNFPGEVSPSVTDASVIEAITRDGYTYVETVENDKIPAKHLLSKAKQVYAAVDAPDTSSVTVVNALASMFSKRRYYVDIEIPRHKIDDSMLSLDLLDKVNVNWGRYIFSSGRVMQIIGVRLNAANNVLQFTLWG